MSVGGKQINFVGYIYATVMRKVFIVPIFRKVNQIIYKQQYGKQYFCSNPLCTCNVYTILWNKYTIKQRAPITYSCPVFNGIKYTFDFADKRTSEKGDAKNTGWLTRGGRTAG